MNSIICCRPFDGRDDADASSSNGQILECDYDSDQCTKLYKLIEAKQWEEILYFLENGRWYFDTTMFTSLIFGKGPDPRFIESRTWVTALDEMGSVRWCQLPLHAAITFQAPFSVITKLVEAYPESIRCADDQDMLPLHYSFRFASEDCIIAYLLEEFPQAIIKKALRDRLPLDMAQYSSKPERGVIIERFVEMSVLDAKAEWNDEHKKALASIKKKSNSSLTDDVVGNREKNRDTEKELDESKKKIQELQKELAGGKERDGSNNLYIEARTGPPSTRRIQPPSGSERSNREMRDGTDPAEENVRKLKGFGKMFGRQKKQLA
ncbi:hypothetical protein FRACYDRAFT_232380 [Fragilariopsis cylindrus CCMP1102]|uniref:Ankyrin repeat protein n=1 Tax=Fragilariopsis cylindrus CCMP1102 TaxID=635003 RepID=A0A1E7FVQ6_9STRA|nr:hypothetical protein FRACYDRAFT_232380 [Fragilariopsis cylindrus CCMP1102]|eukprot:OEU22226.1 hypothetical protein FRACYDRAFT_232380 [Fragilariopsis cylindrus CCMP1102]